MNVPEKEITPPIIEEQGDKAELAVVVETAADKPLPVPPEPPPIPLRHRRCRCH